MSEDNINPEYLAIFLDEAFDILSNWESASLTLARDNDPQALDELFRAAHNLKGGSHSVGLMGLGDYIHKVEDLITLVKSGKVPLNDDTLGLFFRAHQNMQGWLQKLRQNPDFRPNDPAEIDRVVQFMSQQLKQASSADQATYETSEATATSEGHHHHEERDPHYTDSQTGEQKKDRRATARTIDESIRVSAKKLDSLIQLVGELSIQQSVVWHCKEKSQLTTDQAHKAISLSQKIVKDLQAHSLSLRMQSLKALFQRLERAGRDLAREQKKKITFEIKGEDVELDKTVIERMNDPLIHIIRNAIDHGIETSEQRTQVGKIELANIKIEAIQEADGVIINITDDGRGLNTERIIKKAVEKGLIEPNIKLQDHEIFDIIFLPGFSTAEKVTDVSGRGVGMDIVKKTIEDLNGQISIQSKQGQGTVFSLHLPTSLSIVDALIINVNNQKYAVPIQTTEEIIDLGQFRIETATNRGRMLSFRDEVLPVQDLSEYLPSRADSLSGLLTHDDGEKKTKNKNKTALIVKVGMKKTAFSVDSIIGQQQIVVRPLTDKLENLPGCTGITILGNGEPSLIVDIVGIARSYVQNVTRREAVA